MSDNTACLGQDFGQFRYFLGAQCTGDTQMELMSHARPPLRSHQLDDGFLYVSTTVSDHVKVGVALKAPVVNDASQSLGDEFRRVAARSRLDIQAFVNWIEISIKIVDGYTEVGGVAGGRPHVGCDGL